MPLVSSGLSRYAGHGRIRPLSVSSPCLSVCVQSIPPYIRFYRDYAVADFAFCALTTLSVTYASFRYYSFRTDICEELSRHADLMRDLAESGLSLENCEQWFERAVVAFVAVMTIIIVIRVSPVTVHAIYLASDSRMCVFADTSCDRGVEILLASFKAAQRASRVHIHRGLQG